uniref:Potassium channel inwardly rectifying transmembrane domain-containing protein n=1 Tax=Ceratitis capitata TaxID=7213 RepID=W8C4L5_CERCA
MMDQADNTQIRRSISMPVKPRPIEQKSLKRSEEKERINDSRDYYPESPIVERRGKSDLDSHISRSANNVPCTSDWVGSTIELNQDNSYSDAMCSQRRHHRVIEKNGRENVSFRRIPQKSWRYVRDLVTTMVSAFAHLFPKKSLTSASSNVNNTLTPASTKLSFEQSEIASYTDDDAYSDSEVIQIKNDTKSANS